MDKDHLQRANHPEKRLFKGPPGTNASQTFRENCFPQNLHLRLQVAPGARASQNIYVRAWTHSSTSTKLEAIGTPSVLLGSHG